MVYVVIVALISMVIVLAFYILFLRMDIKNIGKQLNHIKDTSTNQRLTTSTFNKEICELELVINELIKKYKASEKEFFDKQSELNQAITNVSHDLRTPLTSAIGYLQLIESEDISEEKREEYLKIVEARLKYLSTLVNQFFELTKAEEGKNLNLTKINIGNMLRNTLVNYYDDLSQHGFEVELEIDDKPIYILADEEAMNRVIQNLIQNALLHGEKFLGVKLCSDENIIRFINTIKDPNSLDVEQLFNRFYTADSSRSKKGSGLGMAITKTFIENMGGNIKAEAKDDFLWIEVDFSNILLK